MLLATLALALATTIVANPTFDTWTEHHGKHYKNEEERAYRALIYKKNMEKIAAQSYMDDGRK